MRALRTTAVHRPRAAAAILLAPFLGAVAVASIVLAPAHHQAAAPPPPTIPTVRVPMTLIRNDGRVYEQTAVAAVGLERAAAAAFLGALHDADVYLRVLAYLHALHDAQAAHAAAYQPRPSYRWASAPVAIAPSGAGCFGVTDPSALYVIGRESGCDPNAVNRSSGACGIGQMISRAGCGQPGEVQVRVFVDYVMSRYGSFAAAAAHERAFGWY